MDWIKKRYDQFILLLAVLALIACGVMVVLKTGAFSDTFAGALTNPPKNNTIPPLRLERVEEAKKALENPPIWTLGDQAHPKGSMLVSEVYVISKDNLPVKPVSDSFRKHSVTGQPIPNTWFMENSLPLTKSDVGMQDPDQDGFVNEDEWLAKTNPNDKESHPPYYTKLYFKQPRAIPFRLIFNAYDGDPKVAPEKMTFEVKTLDLRQSSEFLKVGEMVPRTKFKIEKFEYKEKVNASTGEKDDVSELTVSNTETQDLIILVLTKVTNAPDVYAIFDYVWPQPPISFEVKRLGEFVLRPETDKRYKLIDIKPTEAVIQLPNGDKFTVLPDPRKVGK